MIKPIIFFLSFCCVCLIVSSFSTVKEEDTVTSIFPEIESGHIVSFLVKGEEQGKTPETVFEVGSILCNSNTEKQVKFQHAKFDKRVPPIVVASITRQPSPNSVMIAEMVVVNIRAVTDRNFTIALSQLKTSNFISFGLKNVEVTWFAYGFVDKDNKD
eukprot:c7591_g1_i1.p1 GENE.c7591_g1_i1~~c7591_g1_i1.p1  ORF type:complete len:158 (+),score=43.05 c7591_g1_i1:39-512(+)